MRNTYVPAGSVAPGTCTGALKVRSVRLLIVAPWARRRADAAVTTRAVARTAAPHEMIRVMWPPLSTCFGCIQNDLDTFPPEQGSSAPRDRHLLTHICWRGGRHETQGLCGNRNSVFGRGLSSGSGYERHAS